jgi:hypothetical protein
MDKDGYLVYGDYFEEGEITTFIEIFEAFRFRVAEQEEITKNIEYARKLANKKDISWGHTVLDMIASKIDQFVGKKNPELGKQFIVLIL